MNKPRIAICLGLLMCAMAVMVLLQRVAAQTTAPAKPALFIGATQVYLSNAQLDPNENYQVIRAYVRTGTTTPNCLVTLGDSSFVAFGTVVFCAPREPVGMGKGVLISIFFPTPPPAGLYLSVTLFQEGATAYAPPALCTVEGC
jgi:hypothetical protein